MLHHQVVVIREVPKENYFSRLSIKNISTMSEGVQPDYDDEDERRGRMSDMGDVRLSPVINSATPESSLSCAIISSDKMCESFSDSPFDTTSTGGGVNITGGGGGGLPQQQPNFLMTSQQQNVWPSLNCLQVNTSTCGTCGSSNRSGSSVASSNAGSSAPAGMLQVPNEGYMRRRTSGTTGGGGGNNHSTVATTTGSTSKFGGGTSGIGVESFFEQETEILRSCGAFTTAVFGLMKSFSTSDLIDNYNTTTDYGTSGGGLHFLNQQQPLRTSVSELTLLNLNSISTKLGPIFPSSSNYDFQNLISSNHHHCYQQTSNRRLDLASRCCSTWVAVGDPISNINSQLPSPSQTTGSALGFQNLVPNISGADLVRSVNKKMRHLYIKRRLMSTYRALERLSKSQFDLTAAEVRSKGPVTGIQLLASSPSTLSMNTLLKTAVSPPASPVKLRSFTTIGMTGGTLAPINSPNVNVPQILTPNPESIPGDDYDDDKTSDDIKVQQQLQQITENQLKLSWIEKLKDDLSSVSIREVDLSKGKPLSKYERNMMIFNWLQDLERDPEDDFFFAATTTGASCVGASTSQSTSVAASGAPGSSSATFYITSHHVV